MPRLDSAHLSSPPRPGQENLRAPADVIQKFVFGRFLGSDTDHVSRDFLEAFAVHLVRWQPTYRQLHNNAAAEWDAFAEAYATEQGLADDGPPPDPDGAAFGCRMPDLYTTPFAYPLEFYGSDDNLDIWSQLLAPVATTGAVKKLVSMAVSEYHTKVNQALAHLTLMHDFGLDLRTLNT